MALIATTAESEADRQAAVENLTREDVLATVARTDKRTVVRIAAVRRITDPAVLTEIARTDGTTGAADGKFRGP